MPFFAGFIVSSFQAGPNAPTIGQCADRRADCSVDIDEAPATRIGKGGKRAMNVRRVHVSLVNLNPVALSISSFETFRTGCEKVQ